MFGSDSVSISATTAGVTGTITVPSGAKLKGISISFTETANAAAVVTIVELTWPNSPTPLRFTPNMFGVAVGTVVTGGEITLLCQNGGLQIPLDVQVNQATIVTVKVTSTANLTVQIGLEWE